MIAYWLDFGFYFLDPNPVSWRFPLAFQIVFCFIILCKRCIAKIQEIGANSTIAFVLSLPESPRVSRAFLQVPSTVRRMY
jgi:hypothetical protein